MRPTIFLLLLTATLGVAACGSSQPSGAASTAAKNDPASASKALAFAKCMRSHGVSNFPDPSGGKLDLQVQRSPNSTSVNGVEVNGPAFQAAQKACQSYLPKGGQLTPAQTAKAKQQALAMSKCMRSHGVPNFPDPQFGPGPGGGGFGIKLSGSGLNPNSPAFQAAQKACGGIFGGAKIRTQDSG